MPILERVEVLNILFSQIRERREGDGIKALDEALYPKILVLYAYRGNDSVRISPKKPG